MIAAITGREAPLPDSGHAGVFGDQVGGLSYTGPMWCNRSLFFFVSHSISIRWVFSGVLVLVVSACQMGPYSDGQRLTLAEQMRGVGTDSDQGLQIYGLRNPIVTELMDQALAAEREGSFDHAVVLLEQALLIEPQAPDILQQLAEVRLEQGQWQQAKEHALASIELGPRVGHLCKRNWRTVAFVHRQLGDEQAAGWASERVPLCERNRPERF